MKRLSFILIIVILLSSCTSIDQNAISDSNEINIQEIITETPVIVDDAVTPVETENQNETDTEIESLEEKVEIQPEIIEVNNAQVQAEPELGEAEILEEKPFEILTLNEEYIRFQYPSNLTLEYYPQENGKIYLAELNEVPPSEYNYISIKTYKANEIISNEGFMTEINKLTAVEIRNIVEAQRAILALNPSYVRLISYDVVKVCGLFGIYYSYELNINGNSVITENCYIQNEDVIHELILSYQKENEMKWQSDAYLILKTLEILYPVAEAEKSVTLEAPITEPAASDNVNVISVKDDSIQATQKAEPVKTEISKDTISQLKTVAEVEAKKEGFLSNFSTSRIITLAASILVLLFGIIFVIVRIKKRNN